jgi:L-ribulose-5-phosphate 4-epimerase
VTAPMEYQDLRERVCTVNRGLAQAGLVVLAFGNASGLDRDHGVMAIKPSGVQERSDHPRSSCRRSGLTAG